MKDKFCFVKLAPGVEAECANITRSWQGSGQHWDGTEERAGCECASRKSGGELQGEKEVWRVNSLAQEEASLFGKFGLITLVMALDFCKSKSPSIFDFNF